MATENESNGEVSEFEPTDNVAAVDFEPRAFLPFPVVGVGASAGGVQALESFFDNVTPDSGMAYVVVQHLSPDHTSLLHDILARRAHIPVSQITDGMEVEADHAYVIAPGFTLTLEGGRLRLGEPVEKRGHRRPIDDFFRSLAVEQNEKAIAVILSGTGTNGTAGAQAIKASGGICIAQQPESAGFPGMPRSLIHAGYADQVLEPAQIPEVLRRYVMHPYAGADELAQADEDALQRDRAHLREIIAILRTRTKHDFSGYRKPTLLRRIQRRMGLADSPALRDYAGVLRGNPEEVRALANDLMINVTGFFRDPEAWEALRVGVVAPLVAARAGDSPIRCWVTACASGEEAYTLAMLIVEEMRGPEFTEVKIFATDTADRSLALARAGIYPGGIEADLSPERLDRFFDKGEHVFRVKKEIRDMVVFAPQDVLRDPPFSRIDITCCRNLLIYLEPETQRRVLSLLHFSLREGGYLFLGNTESFSGSEYLFEVVSKRWRIFRRVGPSQPRMLDLPSLGARYPEDSTRINDTNAPLPRPSATSVIQRALLERYGPPTAVVDRTDRVMYFHGATSDFFEPPVGEPTRDLLQLVRAPLRVPVRTALRAAMRDNAAVSVVTPIAEGGPTVEISAAPLLATKAPEYFLVTFAVVGQEQVNGAELFKRVPTEMGGTANEERRLLRLELENATEAYEASNEELKAAHEEATSMNEELQSANEELETSKEELQSINEELTTVNNQLQSKISQLEATTNDLANLLSSTDIAVVFLDEEFRVRRFTPAVTDLLELIETDIGRPVTDLAQKFSDDNLMADARSVLQRLIPVDRELRSHSGRWYLRRTLPYRTSENRIEGVVITFIDIGARKRAEAEITDSRDRVQAVLEQMPTAVVIAEAPVGRLMYANRLAVALFGRAISAHAQESLPFIPTLEGRKVTGQSYRQQDWPFARSLASDEIVRDEEIEIQDAQGQARVLSVSSAPVRDADDDVIAVVGTFFDITQRKRAEQSMMEAEQRFRLLVESATDFAIFTLNQAGDVLSWNPGAQRILGWSEAEIVGQSADILFTPEDRAAEVPRREIGEAMGTGRATDERWHMRKDGTRFWASGVMARMQSESGAVTGLVKIMRDTTDTKLTEDQLRLMRAQAERAQESAESANRAKDEFIAVVSHELRTPLNTIRLWARMLGNEKLPAKDRIEGLQTVERAAVAQQRVIDDLFDVSRIASGKLKLSISETRLADLIRAAVDAIEPVANTRGIRIGTEIQSDVGLVHADSGRLQQVVWNLLSNAVKFTPEGGHVSVKARREAGDVVIDIADTGIGIKPEFLPHVFERFRQAEIGSTRAHGGLGLGLAIAKQIVELHGGRISVDSLGPGRGAVFTVRLPAAQRVINGEGEEFLPELLRIDLKDIDILLVEDEAITRDVMRRLLETSGAKVRAVDSVAAARDEIGNQRPQLLISDIGLPGEDGYALIRYVRKLDGKQRIAALAVTAFTRPEDRQNILEAGFDEHLGKPMDPNRLLELAARLATRNGA